MKVAIVYCFPTVDPSKYVPAAKKFVSSYLEFPGGAHRHELHVVINDQRPVSLPHVRDIFKPLDPAFHSHSNWGKDLGAFILAAQTIDCDLMICAGSHVNFWKPGWLDTVCSSFSTIGPAVYGTWAFQEPMPHIRTTFFWLPPELLATYPHLESESDRYGFEHGPNSICLWSRKLGFEPFQITWQGAYSMKHWHAITLDEGLALDQHTQRHHGK